MNRLAQVRAGLRRYAVGALDLLLRYGLNLRCSSIYEQDGPPTERSDTCRPLFREGGIQDLASFDEVRLSYSAEERLFGMERLLQGDRLLVGELDGDVVFYAWLMFSQLDLDQRVFVPLNRSFCYSYRVFTAPGARGRHLCAAYYSYLRERVPSFGCSRLICRIGSSNRASIRAHERAGFLAVGRVWKLVALGWSFYVPDTALRQWLADSSPSAAPAMPGWLARFGT